MATRSTTRRGSEALRTAEPLHHPLPPTPFPPRTQITVTRQIVIGGKNKYLINGKAAEASKVQNLFHSVQLNVNNPHFLIMQGRITKASIA